MFARIITVIRQPANETEGTGTFADGLFPLTSSEQLAFDKVHSFRASYERDYGAARKVEQAQPAYA